MVNLAHPRKSSCTCPHAAGRQLVCKHMVAVYFTAFPQEAKQYIEEIAQDWDDGDEEAYEEKVVQRVQKMTESELQQALMQMLFDGPDWQYERFIRDYVVLPDENN